MLCVVTTNLLKVSLLCTVKNIHKESKFAKAIHLRTVKATLAIFTLPSGA